jgi:predicted ATPase
VEWRDLLFSGPRGNVFRQRESWVFFDRCLIDAAAGHQYLTGEKIILGSLGQTHRYHQCVFLTPPWPEIYLADPERRHGLDCAVAEYFRLPEIYLSFGYEVCILPKIGMRERADFVITELDAVGCWCRAK